MMDPQTAYYFKKFYRNIIKWWFVDYNPDAKRIWPSKAEEEEALLKEEKERAALAEAEAEEKEKLLTDFNDIYNETTGSFSGLYGQGEMDDDTQYMLNEIMYRSSSQISIDTMIQNSSNTSDVILPPEQDEIIREANAIYERLLREAREDEERKAAEIEAIKKAVEAGT